MITVLSVIVAREGEASPNDEPEVQPKRRNPYINLSDLLSHTSPETVPTQREDDDEANQNKNNGLEHGSNGLEHGSNGLEHGSNGEYQSNGEEQDEDEDDVVNSLPKSDSNPVMRKRTESYLNATTDNPVVSPPTRLWRKDSYKEATNIESLSLLKARHLSLLGNASMLVHQSNETDDDLKRLRIKTLLDHERANTKYNFPLIGSIPPSALRHFTKEAVGNRPPSTTSDYGSSAPAADDSPRNSSHTKISSPELGPDIDIPDPSINVTEPGVSVPGAGINIPKRDSKDNEFIPSSLIVGSIPSKMMNGNFNSGRGTPEPGKKERSTSLPEATLDIDEAAMSCLNVSMLASVPGFPWV